MICIITYSGRSDLSLRQTDNYRHRSVLGLAYGLQLQCGLWLLSEFGSILRL